MCAYCEEQKPLFSYHGMTADGIKSKIVTIIGRKIVTSETCLGETGYARVSKSDFELDYCLKCGRGLTNQTTDVQSLWEMDKE